MLESRRFDYQSGEENGPLYALPQPSFMFLHVITKRIFAQSNRMKRENTRIQFVFKNMTIQENTTYSDAETTINKLSEQLPHTYWKSFFIGQSTHRLAHEYYGSHFNPTWKSQMSPQLVAPSRKYIF